MRVVRRALGVAGELCITVGVVVLLFVVWQVGFDAAVQGRQQQGTVSALEREFGEGSAAGHLTLGPTTGPGTRFTQADLDFAVRTGRPWGILRIPRLGGPTWAKPIYEGVGLAVLAQGLGHYPGTGLPGAVGNIAVAGHRAGHGNPLIDIDRIESGDVMVIETREAYFVYRAVRHEIVEPTDVSVLDPVPQRPGLSPTVPAFTLTSCNPRYGSSHRYIVFSTFVQKIPHAAGLPSALLADPAAAA
ncbi:MAG: class E sortase [Actinomycetota bacterium]|nr:class E sortase [Actinomycetota bacterium]